jgi:GDP-L-fucose synthase
MEREDIKDGLYNAGTGTDVTIRELAETIAGVAGFKGKMEFDASKPDGTPRKLLDVSRLAALGWRARIPLTEGIRSTYANYLAKLDTRTLSVVERARGSS